MSHEIDVVIREVGPSDGLQGLHTMMATEAKKAWLSAEAASGVKEIEVGSFVARNRLPQMADTAELIEHALTIEGLTVSVLVPNLRAARRAIAAGAHKLVVPVSVSASRHQRILNRTHRRILNEVSMMAAAIRELPPPMRPKLEGGLSAAFGASLEGIIECDAVVTMAVALMEAGCDKVGLSDSTGCADPLEVWRVIRAVRRAVGDAGLAHIHLHNARGLGLANVLAALDAGLSTIDACLGGLGGSPFSPTANFNLVTEDIAFLLESMGLNTGIDLERLYKVRQVLTDHLPGHTLREPLDQAALFHRNCSARVGGRRDGRDDGVDEQAGATR
jgi:hydroxymethylglutaryl-CoA lyase